MAETKEIGGYFGLEELISHEYYPDLAAVNNARCALLYIIKAKHYHKVYLPYFLCDSVKLVLEREKIPYEEYRIDRSFLPLLDIEPRPGEVVYVVNYYGLLDEEQLTRLKNRYNHIVVDNAQAFFARPVKGIDTLYSCRKFFGVPDGGYVYTDAAFREDLPVDVSMDRMKHILGRFEGTSASKYYDYFNNNDESFKEIELRQMSKLTHNILGAIDYPAAKRRREENFLFLSKALGERNPLEIHCPAGPYAYPFYVQNGMAVKKQLAKRKIYVATLWPNVLGSGLDIETDFTENILPLPCDQRYSEADMQRVADAVRELI
ncbi:MAG: hypothetical protein IKQ69_04225 [Oscillospiraceae bacterium]|nr:hypothetical protein [Oscillospiraceae bacterium]